MKSDILIEILQILQCETGGNDAEGKAKKDARKRKIDVWRKKRGRVCEAYIMKKKKKSAALWKFTGLVFVHWVCT